MFAVWLTSNQTNALKVYWTLYQNEPAELDCNLWASSSSICSFH